MHPGVKILIIDQNKVYASIVKEELHKAHTEVSIDIAVNKFELKRKLAERKYNLIIVDMEVTDEEDEIAEAISKSDAHVITWTSVNKKKYGKRSSCVYLTDCAIREVRKPSSIEEMRKMVPMMVAKH